MARVGTGLTFWGIFLFFFRIALIRELGLVLFVWEKARCLGFEFFGTGYLLYTI